jgi:hypothetical protein
MKKTVCFLTLIVLVACVFCGCGYEPDPNYVPPEQPHLYWKDIDVVVTDISKKHWFGGTHWYQVDITVESEEYGLERTFTYKGSGMFGCPSQWEYDIGDVVKAELYSWVMDSTGEVTKRTIHRVY